MASHGIKDTSLSIGLLLLRAGVGSYMLTHGFGKLTMLLNGDEFPADPLGMGKGLTLFVAVLAEFVCPLLVIVGLGTRLAAIPVVATMAVAAFVVHADDPWTMGQGNSKEPALLFLIPFLALVFTGPGRFAVDHRLAARRAAKGHAGKGA